MVEPKLLKLVKLINVESVCRKNEVLSGILVREDLPRLQTMPMVSLNQSIEVRLKFSLNERKQPLVMANLKTKIDLICQRCLQPFMYLIDTDYCWLIVQDDEQAKDLPTDHESILVGENGMLNLYEVIEDELILTIPIVPMHENQSSCREPFQNKFETSQPSSNLLVKNNPFEKLANLKKKLK